MPYASSPNPLWPGTDAGAQAIGLASGAGRDPVFRARVTASTNDLNMDGVAFGAGGHMDAGDAALVAGRAARAIAAGNPAYALPGSPVAIGVVDDTGPIAVQATETGPRSLTVTLHIEGAGRLAPLDADAAPASA